MELAINDELISQLWIRDFPGLWRHREADKKSLFNYSRSEEQRYFRPWQHQRMPGIFTQHWNINISLKE